MPTSNFTFKDAVFNHIKFVVGFDNRFKILDVGAGYGTYARGIPDLKMDALEVYQPYIDEYNLKNLYNNVYCGNILTFDYDGYDYIIMGDVLEHLQKKDAIKLIEDISNKKIKLLVGVPYKMEQSSKFNFLDKDWDVEFEIHHQPDLTHRIIKSRYPSLEIFLTDNRDNCGYAYYTNYLKWIF